MKKTFRKNAGDKTDLGIGSPNPYATDIIYTGMTHEGIFSVLSWRKGCLKELASGHSISERLTYNLYFPVDHETIVSELSIYDVYSCMPECMTARRTHHRSDKDVELTVEPHKIGDDILEMRVGAELRLKGPDSLLYAGMISPELYSLVRRKDSIDINTYHSRKDKILPQFRVLEVEPERIFLQYLGRRC